MACYSPKQVWKGNLRPDGKQVILFKPPANINAPSMRLPCGRCIGCRLEYSRQWALRCVQEASCWQKNCFITLTYNDENLPRDGSLNLRHWQLFMKSLRKKYGKGIRFFHCGEYGEVCKTCGLSGVEHDNRKCIYIPSLGRPHYHSLLFNFDFDDRIFHRRQGDNDIFRSPTLEKLWPYGFSEIGSATFESAAYVARYVVKKITGSEIKKESHYEGKIPEYITMSRGGRGRGLGGIGSLFYQKFATDFFPKDFIVFRGQKMRPPKFYDKQLEKQNPELYKKIKAKREESSILSMADNTLQRLQVKEELQEMNFQKLKRHKEKF